MRHPLRICCQSLVIAMIFLVPGCGSDSSPTGGGNGGALVVEAPASWVGRYAGTVTDDFCVVPLRTMLAAEEPDTFSICEGDAFRNEEDLINCTASWTANELSYDCSASFSVAGCIISATVSGSAVLDGDAITFDANIETASSGTCEGEYSECVDVLGVYERISATPLESECEDISIDEDFPQLGTMSMHVSDGTTEESFEAILSAVRFGNSLQLLGSDAVLFNRGIVALNRSLQIYIDVLPEEALPVEIPVGVDCLDCASVTYQELEVFELFGFMNATEGTVNLTQLDDDQVAGTFSASGTLTGELSGARSITSGTFSGPLLPPEEFATSVMKSHLLKHLRGN